MSKLTQAAPLVKMLVHDPSLRGLSQALIIGLRGARSEGEPLDAAAPMLGSVANTLESVAASQSPVFSWETLVSTDTQAISRRRLISVQPVLFTGDVEPGRQASDEITKTAAQLRLPEDLQASVRLTGPVPVRDEEFASLEEGAGVNGAITGATVLLILSAGASLLATRAGGGGHACHRSADDRRPSVSDLGRLEPGFDGFRGAFRWLGRGFLRAVQHAVPGEAARTPRFQSGATGGGRVGGPPAHFGRGFRGGGLSVIYADVLYGARAAGLSGSRGCGMFVAYLATFLLLPALMSVVNPPDEAKQIGQPWLAAIDHLLNVVEHGCSALPCC